jgi:hypothetical protein
MRSKPMILAALLLAAFLVNLDTTLIGSVYASVYGSRLTATLPAAGALLAVLFLPAQPAQPAQPASRAAYQAGTAEAAHQAEARADPASPVR